MLVSERKSHVPIGGRRQECTDAWDVFVEGALLLHIFETLNSASILSRITNGHVVLSELPPT
jgi:hypothetical protein